MASNPISSSTVPEDVERALEAPNGSVFDLRNQNLTDDVLMMRLTDPRSQDPNVFVIDLRDNRLTANAFATIVSSFMMMPDSMMHPNRVALVHGNNIRRAERAAA
jgi:hypothetical protein